MSLLRHRLLFCQFANFSLKVHQVVPTSIKTVLMPPKSVFFCVYLQYFGVALAGLSGQMWGGKVRQVRASEFTILCCGASHSVNQTTGNGGQPQHWLLPPVNVSKCMRACVLEEKNQSRKTWKACFVLKICNGPLRLSLHKDSSGKQQK